MGGPEPFWVEGQNGPPKVPLVRNCGVKVPREPRGPGARCPGARDVGVGA